MARNDESARPARSGSPHKELFWLESGHGLDGRAVCLQGSGELVGNLDLNQQQPQSWRTFELGYVFNPPHWGKGYATEAAGALVSACFDRGAHRVVARCNPQNGSSWRLLERLGFRREGHLVRSASFASNDAGEPIWHDAYLYAALAEEWSPPSSRRV